MNKNFTIIVISLVLLIAHNTTFALTQEKPEDIKSTTTGVNFRPTNPSLEKPNAFIYELKLEEKSEDYVTITNTLNETIDIDVYTSDAYLNRQGDFAARLKSEKQKEAGIWVIPENDKLTLQPYEVKRLKLNINIPKDIKLGDYSGALSISRTFNTNSTINTTLRVIAPIYLKITNSPRIIPKLNSSINPLNTYYLYFSICLFAICTAYFFIIRKKDKKASMQNHEE